MLGNKDAVANIAVKNIDTARKFYEGILGLTKIKSEGDALIVFRSGSSLINVYQSEYAGTHKATAVTWVVATRWNTQCACCKGIEFITTCRA